MSDEKDLPGIPSSIDSALRRPLEAMRESIQRLMGMRGADGRAAVRWDDLADEGLASLPRRRLLINQAIEQGATGGGSGGSGGSYVPDLTKPPTPAGLDGVGAITSILLSWTAPAYTVGHGHKQTNVYATKQAVSSSTLYTINDAVRVNTAPGAQTVLAHTSDPNLKWRIWIKFESVDGVESDPAGGVNGFVVSTGQDVTHLLEILTGQIANSQLATALSTKIELIDAPHTTEGSVDARIKIEQTTRANETGYIGSLYSVRTQLTAGGKTVIGGFGLMGTSAPDAGTTIDFGVSADKFWVGAPTGSTGVGDIQPFVVQTTDQTVNGVLIPKGVYMDAAYIKNLTAMVSRLGSAWIDNGMVANMSAAKLTVGDGTIGGNLKSTNYVSGTSGWIVRPNGTAEFGFAHIRGTLLASQVEADFITATMIDSRGLSIKDASGDVILSAGSAIDWSKLGGASSNLSGLGYAGALDATRNVYRGAWVTATAYKVGDVTTSSGSSWSARVDHTSSNGTNNPPTLPTTSNTWWELSAAKGDIGSTGPASISAVLSNEAHVFPATSDGTVSAYTGSGTEIRVYEGATELSYDGVGTSNGTWKVATSGVNVTPGALTDSGTYLTVGVHSGVAAGTDSSSITYTITGKSSTGTSFTITKAQTFGKSKQGAGGANATSYWLQTSAPAVQKSIAAVYTPSSVTYTLMSATGAGSPAVYAGRFIIATSTDGTTYTDQYTSAANESAKAYTVPAGIKTIRIRGYLAGGTTTLVDELITTIVSDGATGSTGAASLSAVMSNEAHVLPAATDGTVSSYVGSGTELRVYEGATELAYDGVGTANGSWKATLAGTNITPGSLTDSGAYLTVGAHSAVAAGTDTSSIAYTITGKSASGTSFTLTKTQTFTKSKQGAVGSAGPAVVVTASRATTFTATDGTLDAAQADITFTAAVSGIASPTYVWTFSGFQTAPTNSGTATQVITSAQFGTAKAATVRLTVNGTYQDDVTIVRLEKSTAAAGATVGAPAGTTVGGTAAETVAVKALAALQKTGDTITGRINMSVADGLFAGSDLDNGIYLGNSGLVGKKAGVTTFAVDTAGNAVFAGEIAAGSIDVEKLSGITTTYSVAGTYTFTMPAGFTVMRLTVTGGGGGGGGARGTSAIWPGAFGGQLGSGGGQGGTYIGTFTGLTPGSAYTVVVGDGGTPGGTIVDASIVTNTPPTPSPTSGAASSVTGPGISVSAAPGQPGSSVWFIDAEANSSPRNGGAAGSGGGAGYTGEAGHAAIVDNYSGAAQGGSSMAGGAGAGGNGYIRLGDGNPLVSPSLLATAGQPGRVIIEAYNPNGIVKRSEWDTLITHLNARFTSYTWP